MQMQKIEVIVRITKDHCPPQEQTIFEWIETNRATPDTLNYPGLEINLEHRRVFKNGQEVYMSRYEYGILSLMARHPGQLFTKEQIFEAVWHQDSESCLTAVTNTIGRIRDIPVPLNVRKCAIKLRDTTDQFIWESPKTGLPCNPTHFRDVFRKSLEEAGDVRLLTPHSCRHTYVSQMQALGVDIQTIQSIVGHADTEMTEHYLHVQESIRQSAIQLFSEAFSA